jgi:N6-adenosine-specific RNA methylase IME4
MGRRAPTHRPGKDETISSLTTTEDIAKEAGLSKRSAQQRTQIARDISPNVKEIIRNTPIADSTTQLLDLARLKPDEQIAVAKQSVDGQMTIYEAKKKIKKDKRDKQIQEQIKEIEQNDFTPPTKKYDVIVVDPPWPYGTKYDPNGRRAANPYPEMSLDDIKAIELPASDDCVLWLWTTHKFMRYSFDILDAWGFRDVAIITWVKDRMGLGTHIRSQSEFCIMALRGKPTINLTNQTTVVNGKLKEHSRKPDEFYEMVNSLCVGYKLDYFSREQREGWDQYGNDTNRF